MDRPLSDDSQWRIQDFPLGGGEGTDLRLRHFSVKMHAKTKELDPVEGRALAAPPGSANDSNGIICT